MGMCDDFSVFLEWDWIEDYCGALYDSARYMSVGMTPGELRKMFCIEAFVIAGRPVFTTLPLAVAAAGYML